MCDVWKHWHEFSWTDMLNIYSNNLCCDVNTVNKTLCPTYSILGKIEENSLKSIQLNPKLMTFKHIEEENELFVDQKL